jgi:hypothetical protein
VKDYLRWADGWDTTTATTPTKKKATASDKESAVATPKTQSVIESKSKMDGKCGIRVRPEGTKAAKEA